MTLRGRQFIPKHFFFIQAIKTFWLHLLDGCTLVALVPPGLGWVEVATPQLPVEALG